MRYALVFFLASTAAAQSSPEVEEILRPALHDASLGESLAFVAQDHDPGDPATAGFSREVMEARVVEAFAKGTDVEQAQAFAAWTRRPDVSPFLAMERASGSPDYEQTINAFFDANEVDPRRVALVEEFLDAMGYGEYAAAVALHSLAGLGLLMDADEGGEPSAERLDELVDELEATRGDQIYDHAYLRMLDTYYVAFADASLPDLERFVDAVWEDPAQWYAARLPVVMLSAYDRALVEAAQEL